eukprot:6244771-Lingulodinium_polyedra.AAC.1
MRLHPWVSEGRVEGCGSLRGVLPSPSQEVELRAWCWIKEHAEENSLRVLPWERDILEREALPAGCSIQEEVLQGAGTARRLVTSLAKVQSLGALPGKIGDNFDSLVEHDPFWRLDDRQLKSLASGDAGMLMLEALCMAAFPNHA